MSNVTPEDIDALLPQTQCGLCGYGGCMPYAEAILYEGAGIDLCPPGGTQTLLQLGNLLGRDPTPSIGEMLQKQKPPMTAIIREAECIGCTKCISACPVDAIVGSAKQMHTVITAECTGCELCIPPCPVDCIDLLPSIKADKTTRAHYRTRFNEREKRLALQKQKKQSRDKIADLNDRQDYIKAACARARAKKKT